MACWKIFFVKDTRWTHLLRVQTVAADVDGAIPVVGRGYLAGVELVMRELLTGRGIRTSVCVVVVVVGQSETRSARALRRVIAQTFFTYEIRIAFLVRTESVRVVLAEGRS